jgi:hypothetical protein
MKRMILGWLAAGMLAVPLAAQSAVVTVDGQQWSIDTVNTSYETGTVLLESQPWWNKETTATKFAEAWGKAHPATLSPYFAWLADKPFEVCDESGDGSICAVFWNPAFGGAVDTAARGTGQTWPYAVASPVPLPGALGLLGLGLASLLGFGTRRRQASTV